MWAAVTTGTSTGAVNAMHDSFTPIGGLVPMFLMMLGEITPGGVGAGMYGMLVFVLLAVFIAGLMVGRTPEYLGKKIEAFEMKMAMIVVLVLSASILGFTAVAVATGAARQGPERGPARLQRDPVRLCQPDGQQRSAFAGLTGNTPFYNITGALAMLIGRFAMIIPILAIAGSLAAKRRVAPSPGTFPTTGRIFVGPADRRGDHRRRAQLLPRPRPGSDRGAAARAAGQAF